ncbi:MAG TPA: RNA polymerase factor sigma-54 [Bacteroidales bacterium]|jgi:RNA polymerase sigma-54 factor|nr:RNA polymerase factor sigma-54 [Bacteroidales bacterium]MCZ2417777.1 RNA polymerase factor sigma-54 [Burkholderiales bacterium]OQC56782.1 MAG: RNA polymerase sigma-54 factor [Bacteroidetes bacterium ADurb.Bin013]MBP8998782.1 RNA polymerase factor sigma-54 [Bacteroidales bacterium]MBV6456657.1 RNA polymerase sigma-54 factor [Bacteroidales bacterium]
MLSQSLQQKLQLKQKLSPLQIQTIKLLELPALELDQRVRKELEENPVLETKEGDEEPESAGELSLSEYTGQDDSIPSYKLYVNNQSRDMKKEFPTFSVRESFHQNLEAQLGFRSMTDKEREIALFVIGSLDDDGYLRRDFETLSDDMAFRLGLEAGPREIEQALSIIQEFDPPGVGARDLQECLLLQLRNKEQKPAVETAHTILEKHFAEFTKKHYDKIIARLGITEDELKEAIEEILRLNPKPGGNVEDSYTDRAQQVVPDFMLEIKEGEPVLSLPRFSVPELRINKRYADMLLKAAGQSTRESKEAATFVKQKLDSAKWFIEALKQRQNTLFNTMKAILDFQKDYFAEGDETKLKPMVLKNIAEITGLDISTISRVVNSKYIQTHFGIYSLKYFFSEGLMTESGEEVSTREIKNILVQSIEQEDKHKPLTDEELVACLNEKGYKVARRTVAKYREQLNIPIARLRKQI